MDGPGLCQGAELCLQKVQDTPTDPCPLFYSLSRIKCQCEIGVVPAGKSIAVKGVAEVIAPEKQVPGGAPIRSRIFRLILITDKLSGDSRHNRGHYSISGLSGPSNIVVRLIGAGVGHLAICFLLFFGVEILQSQGMNIFKSQSGGCRTAHHLV